MDSTQFRRKVKNVRLLVTYRGFKLNLLKLFVLLKGCSQFLQLELKIHLRSPRLSWTVLFLLRPVFLRSAFAGSLLSLATGFLCSSFVVFFTVYFLSQARFVRLCLLLPSRTVGTDQDRPHPVETTQTLSLLPEKKPRQRGPSSLWPK